MKLRLENYKSLTNHSFDFSKVNILIGENSSGKSSLLKFFLLLKQSLMGYRNRSSFNIALKGEYFDFGSFKDLISFNDNGKSLIFEIEFSDYHDFFVDFITSYLDTIVDKHSQLTEDFLNLSSDSKVTLKFEIDSNIKSHEGTKTTIYSKYIGEITLNSSIKGSRGFKDDICNILFNNNETIIEYPSIEFEREGFLKFLKSDSLQDTIKEQNNISDDKEVVQKFLPIAYLLVAQNYLETILNRIEYINPIHSNPKRYFMLEETSEKSTNYDLEYIVNALNDGDIFTPKIQRHLINSLNEAIKFLGIADEIKFETAKNIPVVELKAKIRDLWSNITDVGFGLSLQLPILFRTIIAGIISDNKIIFIEQPEVHLHPQLQAKFIETIIKFGGNSIFYIETHSEHIIRKLQSLVKHQNYNLKNTDISIYYFKREDTGSKISKHEILDSGKLDNNFPSGFFDTSYLLAKELL